MPYLNLVTGKVQEHCSPPAGFIVQRNHDGSVTVGAEDLGTMRLTQRQAVAWARAIFKVMTRVHWTAGITELLGREATTRRIEVSRCGSSFKLSIAHYSHYPTSRNTRVMRAHELRDFVSALFSCIET